MSKELNLARNTVHAASAKSSYFLEVFGDYLAKREDYKSHTGMEAIYYFLMLRHNWTPSHLRSMNHADLDFALSEEMQGWTLPKEARI